MIKPSTQNSESESQEEKFNAILECFKKGSIIEGRFEMKGLAEDEIDSFIKYASERPDKKEIGERAQQALEELLKK